MKLRIRPAESNKGKHRVEELEEAKEGVIGGEAEAEDALVGGGGYMCWVERESLIAKGYPALAEAVSALFSLPFEINCHFLTLTFILSLSLTFF